MNEASWIQVLFNYAKKESVSLSAVPAKDVLFDEGFYFTPVMQRAWQKIVRRRQEQAVGTHARGSERGSGKKSRRDRGKHSAQGALVSQVPVPVKCVVPKLPPVPITMEQVQQMDIPDNLREQLIVAIRLLLVLRVRAQQLERVDALVAASRRRIEGAPAQLRELVTIVETAVLRAQLAGDW